MLINKNKSFLENAAFDSSNDNNLWIRYLNKFITNEGNKITSSLYKELMESDVLNKDQKKILKEAMIPGTYMNHKVLSLSCKKRVFEDASFNFNSTPISDTAFELLNDRLKQKGLSLDITCAGGFVLQTLGIRATMDVDAFFSANSTVQNIINSVGDELGINEDDESWLNNSISNLNKKPDSKYCELYRSYSNLNIYMVIPEYLIGMKLKSGREKDMSDVAQIIKKLNLTSPADLFKKLNHMKFRPDFADILGCFGEAYGNKWLMSYYKEHQDDILKYS